MLEIKKETYGALCNIIELSSSMPDVLLIEMQDKYVRSECI